MVRQEAPPGAVRHHVVLTAPDGQGDWLCPRFPASPAAERFSEPAEDVLAEYGVPVRPFTNGAAPFVAGWYVVVPGSREIDLRVLLPAEIVRPSRLAFDLAGETLPIAGASGRITAVVERLVGEPSELVSWFAAAGGARASFSTELGVLTVAADGTWCVVLRDPTRALR